MGLYIVIAITASGFALGFFRARRRGGALADALQWGLGHGIAALLLAVALTYTLALVGIGG